jgi:DNA-binding IclR family transcriptional regulator
MSVQSVERAFALLGCLAGGPAGVSELSARVGLPKSTVSRLLATLEALGAVEQLAPGGAYQIGDAVLALGRAASHTADLVVASRPHLIELALLTGEATGVSVLDGSEVHYLDQVASDHAVQVRDWTGERVAAHVVSSGQVLLAALPQERLDRFLARPLARFTERSITDADELRARLASVRADGYAWVRGEFSDDIDSVAAPVRGRMGRVVAALHVHGPSYRFPAAGSTDAVVAQLRRTASRLSQRLAGY